LVNALYQKKAVFIDEKKIVNKISSSILAIAVDIDIAIVAKNRGQQLKFLQSIISLPFQWLPNKCNDWKSFDC
jgi:hypothetical protein